MKKKRIEKKKPIEPTGSIIPQKDWFKPMENIGVFKKPEIEKNQLPAGSNQERKLNKKGSE